MELDFSMVNLFIGQNNSGKSNILDAIEFAFNEVESDNPIFYDKADIEIYIELDKDEQLKYQLPGDKAKFVLHNGVRELVFPDKTIKYNQTLAGFLGHRFKRLDFDAFHDYQTIEDDFQRLFDYPNNLDRFKEALKKHFPKISADKNAMDIRYDSDGLYEGDRRVTIDRLGSGFRQIFTVLLYIYHPQYSVVLINEPETHLHPAVIKKLLWAMQNSEAGQIIFTTHSPLFITPITLPQVVRVIKENNITKAFSLHGAHYNYQRLIQELNADNLEMFFTDKVILVEGVSDRLLIRGLIDKFYQGDRDFKVIQVHGKGNVKLYADLLNIFQIPFFIVLDKDVLKTSHIRDLVRSMGINIPPLHDEAFIQELKKYGIFILSTGDLEANYPRKYQREDSKSLNALRAANMITESDYKSKVMSNLREIIESL